MKKLILFFAIAFLSLPYFASGQETNANRLFDNWSLNINGGTSIFWGDLRQYTFYPVSNHENEWNASFGIILSKQLNSTFELRGQLIKGNLSGTDRSVQRYFESVFFEYNINTSINISRLIAGINPDRKLSLYAIAGIGFVNYRSLKKVLGNNTVVSSNGYSNNGTVEEKMLTETVIPLGIGLKYHINKNFELNIENTFNTINTDFIDATLGSYKYDCFSYTSLGLTYKFSISKNKKEVIFKEPKVVEIKQTPAEIKKEEPKVIEPTIKEEPKVIEPTIKEEPKVIEPTIKEEPKIEVEAKKIPTEVAKEEVKIIAKSNLSSYEFKVQIFASKNKVGTDYVQKLYKITDVIREDYDGVLYRYSVGSFKKYSDVLEKIKKMNTENKIKDAFVIGIKDGKRLNSFVELLSDEEKVVLEALKQKLKK